MGVFGDTHADKIEIKLLHDILKQLEDLNSFLRFLHRPVGVEFFIDNQLLRRDEWLMADLVLAAGASKNISLHYVDSSGNDLGQVPPGDNPQITADNSVLALVANADGSQTGKNNNTSTADVNVNLSGSAGGFTTTAVVDCQPPVVTPPVPAGVKFVFA